MQEWKAEVRHKRKVKKKGCCNTAVNDIFKFKKFTVKNILKCVLFTENYHVGKW